MWLIFRWYYNVREIWGPFGSRREAELQLNEILAESGRSPSEYSIAEVDHPTLVNQAPGYVCPACGVPYMVKK